MASECQTGSSGQTPAGSSPADRKGGCGVGVLGGRSQQAVGDHMRLALGLKSGYPWEWWLSLSSCPLRGGRLWTLLGSVVRALGSVWSEVARYQFGPHWLLRNGRSSRDRILRPLSTRGECGVSPRRKIGRKEEGEACRLGGIGEGESLTFIWLGEQRGMKGRGSEP